MPEVGLRAGRPDIHDILSDHSIDLASAREFSTNKDTSLKLFSLLERIPKKVPLALRVMEDLLALAPPLLVVINRWHLAVRRWTG